MWGSGSVLRIQRPGKAGSETGLGTAGSMVAYQPVILNMQMQSTALLNLADDRLNSCRRLIETSKNSKKKKC
jgi:hypothetical protein